MACSLDGLRDFLLELQGSTGNTAGKDLALLVEELLQEFSILVVDIFDACFLEAAVFLLLDLDIDGVQV